MKSIYISSTYEDLKDYRRAVADALRDCGYNVDAMEKYPARDDRPKAASEADVLSCDLRWHICMEVRVRPYRRQSGG